MAERIWVDHRIRDDIRDELRRHRRWLETGGPLVGYIVDRDFVVVRAAGVENATRRRGSFQPDSAAVDRILVDEYRRSGGRLRYVGSWHSHPAGSAIPSSRDVRTAQGIAGEPDVGLPSPLQVIVATSVLPWTAQRRDLGCWQWDPRRHTLVSRPIKWTRTDLRETG
ncbi:Mov34/MPN/PAD-1 family protein [Egicoccus sp. AB-alg6-2]|uniref:Mov34/MPN/PAD-1 family protein n=1 Tax=Egicoccus sp. AB-alg6-2 TaxID=3242692 RepID=UPI00359F0032